MLEYSKIPGAFQTVDPAPAARSAPRPVIRADDRKVWTDERTELLKKLWAEGLSASQVAGRLGGVTRNGVIGKVHRLGLQGRATTARMKSGRRRQRRTMPRKLIAKPVGNAAFRALLETEPFVPTIEELVIPLDERKTVGTLEECDCRWPIGDPQEAEFHFCGKQKVKGLPYCEFHARRAFCAADPAKRIGFNNTRRRFGFGREVEIAI